MGETIKQFLTRKQLGGQNKRYEQALEWALNEFVKKAQNFTSAQQSDEAAADIASSALQYFGLDQHGEGSYGGPEDRLETILTALYSYSSEMFPGNWEDYPRESKACQLATALLDADDRESPKAFLKRKNIGKRQLAVGTIILPYRNRDARPVREWDEWEELEPWQQVAAIGLEEETGLEFSLESHSTTEMELETATGDRYMVFMDDTYARSAAVDRVRNALRDDPGMFNATFINQHIDIAHLRSELESDVSDMNRDRFHDDNPSYEDKRDALIKSRDLDDDDFLDPETGDELEITPELETKIDEAIDAWVDEQTTRELNDPIQYLEDIYGEEEARKQAIKIGGIDEDAAAEQAVRDDGVGHFLSSYDGEEIELPGGAVAFRN